MSLATTFGVLGGDRRQLYLAQSLAGDGYPVYTSCLGEETPPGCLGALSPAELAACCGILLLPLPAVRNGALNAPLAPAPIPLDGEFARLFLGKQVYGGMLSPLLATSPLWEEVAPRDYYTREELLLGNAFLTAEGALGLAIHEYEGSLGGSRCLVTGFGRIGKALCTALKGLGAQVDCCARKPRDFTVLRALGCRGLAYGRLERPYDVIFNTVPAPVLTAQALSRQRWGTLLLELASPPGGIDREAARRLGLRVVDAPGLPGRLSPKAAGELIKEAVYAMMEET